MKYEKGKLKKVKPKKVVRINLDRFLDNHVDNVREAIAEIDRKNMEVVALAPFIVVTNSTKS